MKKETHPEYFEATVHCAGCGASFSTGSTVAEMRINVCSQCHPFYTGQLKLVDAEGRVDRFNKRYAKFSAAPASKKETPKKETPKTDSPKKEKLEHSA